ncbi:MAG: hypothetical protein LBE59_10790 [Nevskiaceae bacterium]|nr:hypothetical protein [Nevskiaceae bacterium]
MPPLESLNSKPLVAASYSPRDVLSAAWPLFQASLIGCLPLAVIGVAAGATPGAEAIASGEPRGFMHNREWWALYVASTLLMLICYGGILRQQLALARGARLSPFESMRQSAIGLLGTVGVVLPVTLAVIAGAVLFVLPGLLVLVLCLYAWVAQIDAGLSPMAAIRRSIEETRARFFSTAGIVGAAIAAVLVFVLLSGILLAVVMNLAGVGAGSGHAGLSFSRWVMAGLLSLPVVYMSAVTVSAWMALQANPISPRSSG